MAKYTWKVTGVMSHYNKMVMINDTVETSKLDSSLALRKARVKYKKASELGVKRIIDRKEEGS